MYELHPYEKVVAVPNTATSFANRGEWYNINFAARWKSPELDDTVYTPAPLTRSVVHVLAAFGIVDACLGWGAGQIPSVPIGE